MNTHTQREIETQTLTQTAAGICIYVFIVHSNANSTEYSSNIHLCALTVCGYANLAYLIKCQSRTHSAIKSPKFNEIIN